MQSDKFWHANEKLVRCFCGLIISPCFQTIYVFFSAVALRKQTEILRCVLQGEHVHLKSTNWMRTIISIQKKVFCCAEYKYLWWLVSAVLNCPENKHLIVLLESRLASSILSFSLASLVLAQDEHTVSNLDLCPVFIYVFQQAFRSTFLFCCLVRAQNIKTSKHQLSTLGVHVLSLKSNFKWIFRLGIHSHKTCKEFHAWTGSISVHVDGSEFEDACPWKVQQTKVRALQQVSHHGMSYQQQTISFCFLTRLVRKHVFEKWPEYACSDRCTVLCGFSFRWVRCCQLKKHKLSLCWSLLIYASYILTLELPELRGVTVSASVCDFEQYFEQYFVWARCLTIYSIHQAYICIRLAFSHGTTIWARRPSSLTPGSDQRSLHGIMLTWRASFGCGYDIGWAENLRFFAFASLGNWWTPEDPEFTTAWGNRN